MSMIQNKKEGVKQVIVGPGDENRRIDNFMRKELGKVPKSRIYQMLRRGEVRVNGGRIKQDYRVRAGDKIRIPPVYSTKLDHPIHPGDALIALIQNSLIFENEDMLAVNKPAGVPVHGGSGRTFGIIEIMRLIRPYDHDLQLVHRLDMDTSGCLMLAKNSISLRWLHECLRENRIEKRYAALVKGQLEEGKVIVTAPIRKFVTKSGERVAVVKETGKHASTEFSRWQEYRQASLVRVTIHTGRTHQIRVHAAHIRHPVAGDTKYGDKRFNQSMRQLGLGRMFLHAQTLVVPSRPGGQAALELNAALPEEFEIILGKLSR
jgi:23S rRNA pseudouridine955/2504/2580 synthase